MLFIRVTLKADMTGNKTRLIQSIYDDGQEIVYATDELIIKNTLTT